jgi:hypothetical protein
MKSIFRWFAILLVIIFCSLLMFQNYAMLFETKTIHLFTEDVFGFNFGQADLPIVIYFVICIFAGAGFMFAPAFGLWIQVLRLKRRIRRLEEAQLEEGAARSQTDSGDDLVYQNDPDELEE